MSYTHYDLDGQILTMPNGEELGIVSGRIDIQYVYDFDYGELEWMPDGFTVEIVADIDREIPLALPVSHPAVRKLFADLDDAIVAHCMENVE